MIFGPGVSGFVNPPSLSSFTKLYDVDGLEEINLRIRRNDLGAASRIVSTTLTFYGTGYNVLKTELIDNKLDFIYMKLVSSCCDEDIFTGIVRRDEIEWCSHDCWIKGELTQMDDDIRANDEMEKQLIWDYDWLETYDAPQVRTSVNTYPGFAGRFEDYAIPSVYIRDYFEHACDKLGLTFQSSIFSYNGLLDWTGDDYRYLVSDFQVVNALGDLLGHYWEDGLNPYHYAAIVNQTVPLQRGENPYDAPRDGNEKLVDAEHHVLNLNFRQFANAIAPVFNCDYRIKDGIFTFERRDYFPFIQQSTWLDVTDWNTCYSWSDRVKKSYLRLEFPFEGRPSTYSQMYLRQGTLIADFYDLASLYSERYRSIIEWNDPPSVIQEGEESRVFDTFEGSSFRQSNTDNFNQLLNVEEFYTDSPKIVCLRQDTPQTARSAVYTPLGRVFWNPTTNEPDYGDTTAQTIARVNWPMHTYDSMKGAPDSNLKGYKNLYTNFHFIDDPRQRPNFQGYQSKYQPKGYEFEVTRPFDCADLQSFDIDGGVMTSEGFGVMEEVEFNLDAMTVTIKGEI